MTGTLRETDSFDVFTEDISVTEEEIVLETNQNKDIKPAKEEKTQS